MDNISHSSLLQPLTQAVYSLDEAELTRLNFSQGRLWMDTDSHKLWWSYGRADDMSVHRCESEKPSVSSRVSVGVVFEPSRGGEPLTQDNVPQGYCRARFANRLRDRLVFSASDLANGLATASKQVGRSSSVGQHETLITVRSGNPFTGMVDFPYPVLHVPLNLALATARVLRVQGHVPVILGSEWQFEDVASYLETSKQGATDDLLGRLDDFDVATWRGNVSNASKVNSILESVDWPDAVQPVTKLWAMKGLQRSPFDDVVIALLPAIACWMVPCFLKLGAFNATPKAHVLAAVSKYWHQRYGAQVTAVGSDTIEYTVSRPPQTRAEALELALQHYSVCCDIVEQNYGSVEALAASLLEATVWSFWWD